MKLPARRAVLILLHCTEAYPLNKSDIRSFAINRFLTKLFKTTSGSLKNATFFGVTLHSSLISCKTDKVISKIKFVENSFCSLFSSVILIS